MQSKHTKQMNASQSRENHFGFQGQVENELTLAQEWRYTMKGFFKYITGKIYDGVGMPINRWGKETKSMAGLGWPELLNVLFLIGF